MPGKAQHVVLMQLLVTVLISLALLVGKGGTAAASAFIGGAIGFVPAWLYTWKMVSAGSTAPQDLLRAQYKAEFYKFVATAVMFALTFCLFRAVSAPFLFLTYLATLAVYWVALVTT
jgi:F0F1-type ATP synthase assembly protein I